MIDNDRDGGAEDRELDVEVARKALGFRWVRWNELTAGAKAVEYRNGRFLAPPDHVASHHEDPAEKTDPLAPGWNRFVPAFSKRIEPALDAADEVRLFRRDVTLRRGDDGRWTLRTERSDGSSVAVEGETLPEALCHAVLETVSRTEGADEG